MPTQPSKQPAKPAATRGNLVRGRSTENGERKILNLWGENLKSARLKIGLSQRELADLINLDRSYISDIERGSVNPTLLVILRLAKATRINLGRLLQKFLSELPD